MIDCNTSMVLAENVMALAIEHNYKNLSKTTSLYIASKKAFRYSRFLLFDITCFHNSLKWKFSPLKCKYLRVPKVV